MAACRNCGSTQVDEDGAHGYTICMGCGNVLEDQIIVAESQFSEGSSGRRHLMGSIVTDDGNVIGAGGLPSKFGCHRNSQRRIVEEATRIMISIANRLKLTQQHIDSATMFYKMALSKRILQGKRKSHVCAACLYIVCRTESTPHILLDFSEIIHENMFSLVRTYTRLCDALCIRLPAADPCLFINRYAQRLQLGDKADVISVTAMRLVSRMKRDWMATGRRPSSLCGAALVVACRLHRCNRQISDIAKIVRNASATISKRLKEFSQTPSSRLSIEEFESVDLGEEEDPPAFKALKARSKAKEMGLTLLEAELQNYQQTLENELPEDAVDSPTDDTSTLYRQPDFNPDQASTNSTSLAIQTAYGKIPNYVGGEGAQNGTLVVGKSEVVTTKKEVVKQEPVAPIVKAEPVDLDEGFSDVDDTEIEGLILTPQEIDVKKKIWEQSDLDAFLRERQRKKEEKEAEERSRPKRKYKRVQKLINQRKGAPKSPAEAMETMIKEKKLSTKINYDVLKNLGNQSDETIARIRRDTETEDVKRPRLDTETSELDDSRSRYDTANSALSQDEEEVIKGGFVPDEDDYMNYSSGMALNDAIHTYNDEDDDYSD